MQRFFRPDQVVAPAVAYLMLIITIAAWAGALTIGRALHETIPPVELTFWRWFIAGTCLLPICRHRLRACMADLLAAWKLILFLGLTMIGASALAMLSLNYTTAVNASLINASQPVSTAVLAWLVLGEHLSRSQILGMMTALAGVVLTIIKADLQNLLALQFNIGDLFMVTAALGYSLYATYLAKVPRALDRATALCGITLFGSVALLPPYAYEAAFVRSATFDAGIIGWILFLALVPTLLAIYLWNTAIDSIGVNRSVIFIGMLPPFGALFGVIFLDESLHVYHLAGAALVCVGIVAVIRGHREKPGDAEFAATS